MQPRSSPFLGGSPLRFLLRTPAPHQRIWWFAASAPGVPDLGDMAFLCLCHTRWGFSAMGALARMSQSLWEKVLMGGECAHTFVHGPRSQTHIVECVWARVYPRAFQVGDPVLPLPGAGVGSTGRAWEPLRGVPRWVLVTWTFKGVLGTLQAVSGGEASMSTLNLFPVWNSGVSRGLALGCEAQTGCQQV